MEDDLPTTSTASIQRQGSTQFFLSAIIQAHNDDTKCVVETSNGDLISGGRDGFLKLWVNENGTWENNITAQQKNCLTINSIAFGTVCTADWENLIFVGRKDGSIAIFSPINPGEPIKVLQVHKSNVCTLHFDAASGFLMSGSWDHNAVVWPIEELLKEDGSDVSIGFLNGHSCSVWAVSTVPSKPIKFLTGSADKSIKLWSYTYDEISVFVGHTDVVRAIVVLTEVHFISTSNDATIILWNLQNGTRLRNFLPQHEYFIYTMARLKFDVDMDLIISCGEGGCIDVWRLKADATLEHKQSLKIPVHSIWSVIPMKNKDFAIATSSGMVLIFTADLNRKASDDIQEFFYSSQYEELAAKEMETQKAKDSSFDMSRFSSDVHGQQNGHENINDGILRRVVGTEFIDNSGYKDPFTGSGRYIPGIASTTESISIDKKRPKNHMLPLKFFYKFGLDGLSSKIITRLRDLNMLQPKEAKMTEDEAFSLEQLLVKVDFQINECQIVALEKGLQWTMETIVPVLDVFRISLLHPQLNKIFCSLRPVLGNPSKGRTTIRQLIDMLSRPEAPDPVRILVCRALTNAASHKFGQEMLLTEISNFSKSVSKQLCSLKPALQIAAATALANFAQILLQEAESKNQVTELGPREDVLRSIILAIRSENHLFGNSSPIALVRVLQAMIILMWGQVTLIYSAMELDITTILNRINDAVEDEDVKMLVRDAMGMIQAI